jgi:hypothetical protein
VSAAADAEDFRKQLSNEAERIEEDTEYFFKSQYNAAERYGRLHGWISGAAAVLSAVAGASHLAEFPRAGTLAAGLSILAAALMALTAFLKPSERAEVHKNAAADIQALHDDARIFWQIVLRAGGRTDEDLLAELRVLSDRRAKLRRESPLSPPWAYRAAKTRLEHGQHTYRVDERSAEGRTPQS